MSKYPVPVEIRRHSPGGAAWTYEILDRRQREIAEHVRAGEQGAVLLNEVAPVITRGRRAPSSDLIASPETLERAGIQLYEVNRGGLVTYHGPGQWVLFAVDRLEKLTGDPRGVRKAVEKLLAIAGQVGRQFDPSTHIREGAELGVWTDRGKFAAVGIHIERGVLMHGLAVNGLRTASSFYGLRPCGLDAPVDFLLEKNPLGKKPQAILEERDGRFQALGQVILEATFEHFYR
jgi:lipoyl(octanoyl) transferase